MITGVIPFLALLGVGGLSAVMLMGLSDSVAGLAAMPGTIRAKPRPGHRP